jgi:hypothetical protein
VVAISGLFLQTILLYPGAFHVSEDTATCLALEPETIRQAFRWSCPTASLAALSSSKLEAFKRATCSTPESFWRCQYYSGESVVLNGTAWNRHSLASLAHPNYGLFETQNLYPSSFSFSGESLDFELPFTFVSYGKRQAKGEKTVRALGVKEGHFKSVSYQNVSRIFDEDELARISRDIWPDSQTFLQKCKRPDHYILATLNFFEIFREIIEMDDEEFLIWEDDTLPVYNFGRKWSVIKTQLDLLKRRGDRYDIVWLSSCCKLTSRGYDKERATRNLFPAQRGRCLSAILITKDCVRKILSHGASRTSVVLKWRGMYPEKFHLPIDLLLDALRPELDLKFFYVEPPIAFEESKSKETFEC